MKTGEAGAIVAHVYRYDIGKLRLAQLLVPAAMFASILVRRIPNAVTTTVAVALLVAALFTFIRARRSFGRQVLRIGSGRLRIGDTGEEIAAQSLRWLLLERTARFYGAKVSWKLVADEASASAFESALTSMMGPSPRLQRRGSKRSRMCALAAGVLGLTCVALGISYDAMAALALGIITAMVGFATFGALSQRVLQRSG